MILEWMQCLYWRIVMELYSNMTRMQLLWNKYFNPLRYATLLYGSLLLLGENPQDNAKFIIALSRLPSSPCRHIHNVCVKAFVPQASEEVCKGLYEHFLWDVPDDIGIIEPNQPCGNSNMDIIEFYQAMAQIGKVVNKQLRKIPWEYGSGMTKKQERELLGKVPLSFTEMLEDVKSRHPEYPPEHWSVFDGIIEKERQNQDRTKRGLFHRLFHPMK